MHPQGSISLGLSLGKRHEFLPTSLVEEAVCHFIAPFHHNHLRKGAESSYEWLLGWSAQGLS